MRRTLVSVVIVGTALVATATESRGDAPKNPTAAQVAARTVFLEDLKEAVVSVKSRCGVDLAVTTDFENYDETAWRGPIPTRDPEAREARRRSTTVGPCAAAIEAIARSCSPSSTDRAAPPRKGGTPAPVSPPPGSQGPAVRAVACLFGGHAARAATGEDTNAWVQRNMSLANGVFTFHVHPEVGNVESNTSDVLRPPKDHRVNGAACAERSECASFACADGVCKPCGGAVTCSASATCGSNGVCYLPRAEAPDEPSQPRSPTSRPAKPAPEVKKPLGGKCLHNAECESKKCSNSPKSMHICVAKW